MKTRVQVSSETVRSPRSMQLEGMFDVPPSKRQEIVWDVDLPIEERPWNIGLIVGPSGSGKSTVARQIFPEQIAARFSWPADHCLIDAFPKKMPIKEIVGLLSSVGFSSPPAWLRPFAVLSNGEQFRATMARLLAESPDLAVMDEFTSVVDRTVAKIGSTALAKTVRKRGQKFIAVTCHEDVEEWLDPDWVYRPAERTFAWRSLRGRPAISLEIGRCHATAWRLFKHHHYLSSNLHRASACYLGTIDGRPATFTAVLSFPHPIRPAWREHRTVCLPDFQGAGIGNAMSEFVAGLYAATGKTYMSVTSHPAMIRHRNQSPLWVMTRAPSTNPKNEGTNKNMKWLNRTAALHRFTAGFRYVGPSRPEEAFRFGIISSRQAGL